MKHIIQSIFLLTISVILLSACSMNVDFYSKANNGNDIAQGTSIQKEIVPKTKAPEATDEAEDLPEEHNQGGGHLGNELYPIHLSFAGILSYTPGDNTFMDTRSEEVSVATDEFINKYANCRASRPPLVYYIIHRLDLSREEIEYYYRNSNISKEYIDALFCEDEEEAKKLLKSPYAFQIGENIYNIYEIQQMIEQKDLSDELIEFMNSNEFKVVMENINNYLIESDPMCVKYSKELANFVRSSINQDIAE